MNPLKQILAITAADAQRRGIANPVLETFSPAEIAEAHAHVAIAAAQVESEQNREGTDGGSQPVDASIEPRSVPAMDAQGGQIPAAPYPLDAFDDDAADYDRDDVPGLQQERELMDLALDDPHRGAVPRTWRR